MSDLIWFFVAFALLFIILYVLVVVLEDMLKGREEARAQLEEFKGKVTLWRPSPGVSVIGLAGEEPTPYFRSFQTLFGGFLDKDVKISIEEVSLYSAKTKGEP